ncbi:DUF6973 domain-containing protein [Bacteroides pyogenes]|uniref:DUF6973 domain-containing protein n=1 Tax=Bacteroides pyogenes TaxID=310300 RepID=UPI001FD197AA|nr:hypothetical protein [Bacteroides pyogenes]
MLYLQADLSIEGCLFFKQTKIHIYNETKIKRKNLAELKASMCVIDFEQQSSFVGGVYGDISDPYTWEDYSMVYKWSNPNGYYMGGTDGTIYQNGVPVNDQSYFGDSYTGGTPAEGVYYGGSYAGGTDYDGGTDGNWNNTNPYYANNTTSQVDNKYPWIDIWDSLSVAEKGFIKNNPGFAYEFYSNAKKAGEKTAFLEGQHNGYGDAVRHCYWSAFNQIKTGYSLIPYAEQYGNAHESESSNEDEKKWTYLTIVLGMRWANRR